MHVFWGYFLRLSVGLFELKYKPICVYLEISYLESWMKNSLQNQLLNLIWANRARTMGHPIRQRYQFLPSNPFSAVAGYKYKACVFMVVFNCSQRLFERCLQKGVAYWLPCPPSPLLHLPSPPSNTPFLSFEGERGGRERDVEVRRCGEGRGNGVKLPLTMLPQGPWALPLSLSLSPPGFNTSINRQTDRQTDTHT